MQVYSPVSDRIDFFKGHDPVQLAKQFGTPLYVYQESILRQRCKEMKNFVQYPKFTVDFSAKANSAIGILQIVRSEGLEVDAMSPGEITAAKLAGFSSKQIFYICNNVSEEEMQFARDAGVTVSVDSVSQLEKWGRIADGGEVAIRFNPGVGAGHHQKVVTAGKHTKFGVDPAFIPEVKEILQKHHLTLVGINQHIGSLFMSGDAFRDSIQSLFSIAKQFPGLRFVDMGGGFGIPYHKEEGEPSLDLISLGEQMERAMGEFSKEYGSEIVFRIEPGRYIVAECGILLGTVHGIKHNQDQKYIGTDIGFNVLQRPMLYDSYHGIEIYRPGAQPSNGSEEVCVVGNICESGDILAKRRNLPEILEGDILGVLDAGAYGQTMSSNYNNRLRPAEILLREDGSVVCIRERDKLEDMFLRQKPLTEPVSRINP